MRRPSVTTRCVADQYHAPNERIVEFSFPSGPGGLIAFRILHDGTPVVDVYRTEGQVLILHDGKQDA
jgi:hypothetical protein